MAQREPVSRAELQQVTVNGTEAVLSGTADGTTAGMSATRCAAAVSPAPTFTTDHWVYAYTTTATDNRVVRFPIGGTPNPVFTGIPRGETHNGGGLVFAARRRSAGAVQA